MSTSNQTFKVQLYCYDISRGLAAAFSQQFLGKHLEGIWHSGVVVYNKEFYWQSFLAQGRPGRTPFGTPQRIFDIGETSIPEDLAQQFFKEVSGKYTITTYKLLSNNCNNFSQEFVKFLTGKDIPALILNQPETVLATPFGQMIRPMIENFENSMKQQFSSGNIQGGGLFDQLYAPPSDASPFNTSPANLHSSQPTANTNTNTNVNTNTGLAWPPNLPDRPPKNYVLKTKVPFISREGSTKTIIEKISAAPQAKDHTDALAQLSTWMLDETKFDADVPSLPLLEWFVSQFSTPQQPAGFLFSILYIVRLLLLRPKPVDFFVKQKDAFQKLFSTYSAESTPKPAKLMTYTTAINLFETPEGRNFILNLDNSIFLKNTCDALLTVQDASVLAAFAALLHNFILYSPNIPAIAFLVDIILTKLERASLDEETLFRLLKAIGHSAEKSPEIKQKIKKFNWSKVSSQSERVIELALEIRELL